MIDSNQIEPSKVVIKRRGDSDIVWSTEDGLQSVSMAPFGVVGVFEGKEVRQQMVSWYEISDFTVYDLDFEKPADVNVTLCAECAGGGMVDDRVCRTCHGFGHVR